MARRRFSKRALVGTLAAGTTALIGVVPAEAVLASPASAASWHGVSGTVPDPCGGNIWYESTNARTKSGSGAVKLQFSQLNPGGVTWKLLGKSNQQFGVEQSWTGTETGITRTLDSSMGGGTTFFNTFKEYTGQCGYHNYQFQGSEYY